MRQAGRLRIEAVWSAMVLMVSAHFALIHSWAGGAMNGSFLDLQAYADGTARLPYQARVLMAWVLHAGVRLKPLLQAARHAPMRLSDPYVLTTCLVEFVAMAVAIFCTRRTIAALTGDGGFARWAAFLLAYMTYFNLVLAYGLSYTLPYDVTSVAFFCAGVCCVVERRWWLLVPVFILGTLNRETFCFAALFFAVWEWMRLEAESAAVRVRRVLPMLGLLAVLWVLVKVWLHWRFAANPSEATMGLFQTHVAQNLRALVNPGQWPLFASLFGFLWVPLLLGRRWVKHRAMGSASAVVVTAWVLSMLVVGVVVEVRIFSELSALLAPVAALQAYHLLQRRTVAAPREL